jgi:hypothetical protein
MDKLESLYNQLNSDGLYTKSFAEFQSQFSDAAAREGLYNKLSSDGFYSKSLEDFNSQFFSEDVVDVKKKDDTELSGGIASMVSPKDNKKNQPSIPFKNVEDNRAHWIAEGKEKTATEKLYKTLESKERPQGIAETLDKSKKERERQAEEAKKEAFTKPYKSFDALLEEKDEKWTKAAHGVYKEDLKENVPADLLTHNEGHIVETLTNRYGEHFVFSESRVFRNGVTVTPKYGPGESRDFDAGFSKTYTNLAELEAREMRNFILANTPNADMLKAEEAERGYRSLTIKEAESKKQENQKNLIDLGLDSRTFPEGTLEMSEGIQVQPKIKNRLDLTREENKLLDRHIETVRSYISTSASGLFDELKKAKTEDEKIEVKQELRNTLGNTDSMYMEMFTKGTSKKMEGIVEEMERLDEWQASLNQRIQSEGLTDDLKNEYRLFEESLNKHNAESIDAKDFNVNMKEAMINIAMVKEQEGNLAGAMTNEFIDGFTSIGRLMGMSRESQEDIIRYLGDPSVTPEWMSSEDRTFLEQLLPSLASSVGVMASSAIGGPIIAPYASIAGFYSQTYFDNMDQMNDDPAFDNVSEVEKQTFSALMGVTVGMLERYGVTKAMKGKPSARMMSGLFKNIPKNASGELIELQVKNNIKAKIANGTFKTLGASVTEGSTEMAQEGLDITLKELFNEIKDQEFFEQDTTFSAITERILWSGVMGAAGGSIFSGMGGMKRMMSGEQDVALDPEMARTIRAIEGDANARSVMANYLKSEIMSRRMTPDQAQEALNSYDEVMGRVRKIPTDVNDVVGAFDLISERSNLEKKIEGKDKALSEKDVIRINEINEELKEISTNRQEVERAALEKTPPGAKLFSDPNPETKQIADKYKKDKGITTPEGEAFRELDEARSKELADAYQAMKDDPSNPEVKEAYEALASETMDQYQAMQESGYTIELWEGEGEPYANSGEMIADVRDNKHMYVLSTENEFGDDPISDQKRSENPLLKDSGIKDVNGKTLLINDIFRGVHDFFGHTERGNSFGPKGEENAWDVHARMYSDKARRAMTTETRGQNSYVNFSGVNAEAKAKFAQANKLEKEGEIDEANKLREEARSEFKFAEQKIGLMPEEFSNIEEKYTKKEKNKPSEKKGLKESFDKGADKGIEWIDEQIKKLDDFGKGTLGVSLPIPVAKGALRAAKKAIQAGKSISDVIQAAVDYIKNSSWYRNDLKSDKERRAAERLAQRMFTDPDGAFKGKTPKGKTKVKKDIDKSVKRPKKKVKVDEYTALKDQLKLEARAAKQGSKWERDNRKVIHKYLKGKFKGFDGKLNGVRVGSILNKALTWNLSNPVMAARFEAYIEKVVADSRRVSKIKAGQKAQGNIKKLAKAKDLQVSMKEMALKFASIDPVLVDDIDAHLEMAERVKALITKSKAKSEGKGVDRIMKAVWAEREGKSDIDAYTEEQKKKTEDVEKSILISAYPQLEKEGRISINKTLKQVKQAINEYKLNEKALDEADQNKDLINNLKQEVVEEFNDTKAMFKVAVEIGVDPVTGEKLTKAQAEALKLLAEADVKSIGKIREIMFIRDLMHNFTMNGVTDMVAEKAKYIEGRRGAKEMEASTKKGATINKKGIVGWTKKGKRWYNGLFAQMDQYMRGIFKDTGVVLKFKKLTGFGDLENGVSKAKNISRKAKKAYHDKYIGGIIDRKRKPNGRDFYDKYNVYQRGVYAYLSRNSGGTEQEIQDDFNSRLGVVVDSYEYLSSTGAYEGEAKTVEEERQAEILNEVLFDMGVLGDQEYSLSDLETKTDKTNKEAVGDIVNMWGQSADQLEEAMGLLYNSKLDRDINYTHDSWVRKDGVEESTERLTEALDGGSMIGLNDGHLSTSQSGALMEATKPSKTTPTRRLNFEFEQSQFRAHEAAMMDIHTAAPIHQMRGFFESKASRNILTKEELKALKGRMFGFISSERGGVFEEELESKGIKKVFNALSTYATAKVLGGPKALFLQTIPAYVNMIINTDLAGAGVISHYLGNAKSVSKWIDNEGIDLALRGVKSQADVYINESKMTKNSSFDKLKRAPKAVADFWINNFLVFGDKGIAKASFMAYYKQYYRSKGMNVVKATKALNNDIKSGKMNEEAREYAKHKFNTFGNVSNENLMGKMFTKGGSTALIRKVIFPYATFVMNQKTRVWNDLSIISTKGVTPKEKWMSARSIGSTLGESFAYHAARIGYSVAVYTIVSSMMGWDDEEEPAVSREVDKENKRRRIKGDPPMNDEEEREFRSKKWAEMQWDKTVKGTSSSLVADIFSPMPIFDNKIKGVINDYAITPLQRKMFDKELEAAIKEKNDEVFKLSGGKQKEMTEQDLEKFISDYEQNEFFGLYDREMPGKGNFGVLSIGLDVISEWGKYQEAAVNGRVEIEDSRGNITVKYLTEEDQEKAAAMNTVKLLTDLMVVPPDIGGYTHRKGWKIIEKSALTGPQMANVEAMKEFFKENNFEALTKEEQKMVKSSSKSVKSILEITRGKGSEEWVQWSIDEAIRKVEGMTDSEYLDWKINDILIKRGLK